LAARVASHNSYTWLSGQLGRPRLVFADLLERPRRHHRDEAGGAAALRWQDVDIEKGTVSVRSTLTRNGGSIEMGGAQDQEEPPVHPPDAEGRRSPPVASGTPTVGDRDTWGPLRGPGVALLHEYGRPDQPFQLAPEGLRSPPEGGKTSAHQVPRPEAHLRHTALEGRRQREGGLRDARPRLHYHYPQHLLPRTPRHARLRSRRDGSGVGNHLVSRIPFGLQYGCSK
jgi:hypothetical protein